MINRFGVGAEIGYEKLEERRLVIAFPPRTHERIILPLKKKKENTFVKSLNFVDETRCFKIP